MKYYKKSIVLPTHLKEKFDCYRYLSIRQLDNYGWLGEDKNHSLEFTSLYYAATKNGYGNIWCGVDHKGMWYRHPSKIGISLEELKDRSTISRDMFTGLIHLIWANKQLFLLNELIKYANSHFWKMGNYEVSVHPYFSKKIYNIIMEYIPKFCHKYVSNLVTKFSAWLSKYEGATRVYLSPGLWGVLYNLRYHLGGGNSLWRFIPAGFVTGLTGFEVNLLCLHMALNGEMRGYLTSKEVKVLKWYVDELPHNALVQALYHKYTDGDQSRAIDILSMNDLFPSHRLPTSKDRADYYLWSLPNISYGWLPDPGPEVIHSGVDYLFVCYLLEC